MPEMNSMLKAHLRENAAQKKFCKALQKASTDARLAAGRYLRLSKIVENALSITDDDQIWAIKEKLKRMSNEELEGEWYLKTLLQRFCGGEAPELNA